ncbi:MAG: 1-deoxy-D-xylulose-5-phosphate reductoisomerase [Bacillota bacterium]
MKGVSILGSTGSVGRQTLDVIRKNPGRFRVVGLAAGSNWEMLLSQIREFSPAVVSLQDEDAARRLQDALGGSGTEVIPGPGGASAVATLPECSRVVAAMVGVSGLPAVLAAIEAGKTIALANKETLVAAGELVVGALRGDRSRLIPVDSEHSAIFQCLLTGRKASAVILTASGGPFLGMTHEQLQQVTPAEALAHPTWRMGAKVSIDSATLMNKGLEVIEAHHLFGFEANDIRVVIHPQSIVHSMVEMADGTLIAQMGPADMRLAIQFALSYPEEAYGHSGRLDLFSTNLEFSHPDVQSFPCLDLAYRALAAGGTMPAVLNAANEIAVEMFLGGTIRFTDIPRVVMEAMEHHEPEPVRSLEQILQIDAMTRERSRRFAQGLRRGQC